MNLIPNLKNTFFHLKNWVSPLFMVTSLLTLLIIVFVEKNVFSDAYIEWHKEVEVPSSCLSYKIETDSANNYVITCEGYPPKNYDEVRDLIQSKDKGFAIVGFTLSKGKGGRDVWLVKIDSLSRLQWNKTYGGIDNDVANEIIQTSDGGFAMVGSTRSKKSRGLDDCWIIKVDSLGNVEWDRTFGGNSTDKGNSILQTSDDGYVIAGFTRSKGMGGSDFWLIKTDSEGNMEWDKVFGGNKDDVPNKLIKSLDGGYALVGYTESKGKGGKDIWLVKTTNYGALQWDNSFGFYQDEEARSLVQTSDAGFIIASQNEYNSSSKDIWVIKVNSQGVMNWQRTFKSYQDQEAFEVIQTNEGDFLIGGYTYETGFERFLIMKLNRTGRKVWEQTFQGSSDIVDYSLTPISGGGYAAGYTILSSFGLVKIMNDALSHSTWIFKANGYDEAVDLIPTRDGGRAILGNSRSESAKQVYLVKKNSLNNWKWQKSFGQDSATIRANTLIQTWDGGYALAGWIQSERGDSQGFWLLKTDSLGNHQWDKNYGGNDWRGVMALVQVDDGGYALAGRIQRRAGDYYFRLVKTDSLGNQQWDESYNGDKLSSIWALIQTKDRGYALAGWTRSGRTSNSEIRLVKTDRFGNHRWDKNYRGYDPDKALTLIQTDDEGYMVLENKYGRITKIKRRF